MLRFQMSGHNWQVIPLTPQVHAAPEVGFTWNVARFALLGTEMVSSLQTRISLCFILEGFLDGMILEFRCAPRVRTAATVTAATVTRSASASGPRYHRCGEVAVHSRRFFRRSVFPGGSQCLRSSSAVGTASRRIRKILSNVVTCDGLCRCGDLQDF